VAELTAADSGEAFDAAATRLWAVVECLRKAGQPGDAPITPVTTAGRWQVFASGSLRIATFVTRLSGVSAPVVFAVLAGGSS
jgi:enediyne polyketide synthase